MHAEVAENDLVVGGKSRRNGKFSNQVCLVAHYILVTAMSRAKSCIGLFCRGGELRPAVVIYCGSPHSFLGRRAGARFIRLLIGEDTEAGRKTNRLVFKNPITKHNGRTRSLLAYGLLTYINQMTLVHPSDCKYPRVAERGELMYLFKCTVQGSCPPIENRPQVVTNVTTKTESRRCEDVVVTGQMGKCGVSSSNGG